jgi:hypothetical protein
MKWLLELQGVAPIDPENLFALTIEETQPVDIASQAMAESIMAAQPFPTQVDAAQIEEVSGNVALMLADPPRDQLFDQPIGMAVDGGGAVPSTGSKGFVRVFYDCMIVGWTLIADQAGDCQFTVKAASYGDFPTTTSIVASAPPTLSTAQKNESYVLTGWTTAIAKGTILEFVLDSVATLNRVILELQVERI